MNKTKTMQPPAPAAISAILTASNITKQIFENAGDFSARSSERGPMVGKQGKRPANDDAGAGAAAKTAPGYRAQLAGKLSDLLDKIYLAEGFKKLPPSPNADRDEIIAAWLEKFLNENIPVDAVNLCYERAGEARRAAIRNGKDAPRMTADYIAAQWHFVSVEYTAARAGRMIAAGTPRNCPDCFGNAAGWQIMTDAQTGARLGVAVGKKCRHERYFEMIEKGEIDAD